MTTEKLGQMMKEHLAQHHFGVFFIKGFEVCWSTHCLGLLRIGRVSTFWLAQGPDAPANVSHESYIFAAPIVGICTS